MDFKKIPCRILLVLAIFFLIDKPKLCFSAGPLQLSGKYKECNVILIILDALRPDRLSCYGYSKNTSPNMDALAKQGIIFTDAFSQSTETIASVASIFTSLYPFSHEDIHVFKDKLPEKVYTLAQILDTYGYKTAWFGFSMDPHTGAAKGLLRGFSEKNELYLKKYLPSLENYKTILDWIKQNCEKPFFLTIHSYEPHESWFPFLRFDNKFSRSVSKKITHDLDALEEKEWVKWQCTLKDHPETLYQLLGKDWVEKNKEYFMLPFSQAKPNGVLMLEPWGKRFLLKEWSRQFYLSYLHSLNAGEFSDLLSLLDSAIYEFDHKTMAGLVKGLKELDLYRKTIIIVTADHGNEYNEHDAIGHGKTLYDESIHVPLLFYIPDLNKPVRSEELVQSIDILPTVLDLLGIPIPQQAQGISLLGLMEGKADALTNEYVFAQTLANLCSIRSKKWKLVKQLYWSNPELWSQYLKNNDQGGYKTEEQLFYLVNDKRERNELGNKRKKIAKELRRRLESKLSSLIRYKEKEDEFDQDIDEQTKERIRKTGYW